MEKKITLFSPAKINVFFNVLKKRGDGFHEIASFMQATSLCDTLHFTIASKGSEDFLTCSNPSLKCDESNLIMKGVRLFREKTQTFFPIKIHLEKKIPIEAGLGGGSSNLATTLWALNQCLKEPKPIETLKNWAALLSSDAPFFFSTGTAYVTGRGENIQDIKPSLNFPHIWLAKPSFSLKTSKVYGNVDLSRCNIIKNSYQMIKKMQKSPSEATNDLESAAFALKPNLKMVKNDLFRLGFKHVLMTGSGTAFYCLGAVNAPVLKNVTFYPITFISRPFGRWYCA